MDVQLRLVLAVLRDAVRHGEEHAGESSAGVSTNAGEEDVREPSQVDAVFHRESLESLADVPGVASVVGEEVFG